VGSTKVIGRKPQSGNFQQNFRGHWRKNYRSDPNQLRDAKIGRTSSMRKQSLVEIGGRTTTDEKHWCWNLLLWRHVCV